MHPIRWIAAACVLCASLAAQGVETWPQFRGPEGDGIARGSKPPLEWSESRNVRWKTAIHGRGWASPVGDSKRIWIATATEDGRVLSALSLHPDTGEIIHDLELFQVEDPQFCHKFNSYASPTPVLDGDRLYITFGSPGTACLDATTGKVLWQRRDFVCNHFRGAGSSPILYENLLIMHFDGSDAQFVAALDKDTGNTVWRTDRSIDFKDLNAAGEPEAEGDLRKAFATPHITSIDGIPVLLSQGAKAFYAYEPRTGRELWRVEERKHHSASTRPVVGHGLIFAPTGFSHGQILAIQPGKTGEVVDANDPSSSTTQLQVKWKTARGAPKKPSLIFHDGLLFGVEDGGVATCWDALTGEILWNERLGGNYSASPILADSRIYWFNEVGKCVVVPASRTFEKLAENSLDEGFMASPAVLGDSLIVRTRTHVYRIEE